MTGTAETGQVGRIPPSGRLRDLGMLNWIVAKFAARTVGARQMHLFATLGQHKRLFLAMMPYSAVLLRGRLPRADTELVILRVAHLRGSEYELQHHRRLGRRRGKPVSAEISHRQRQRAEGRDSG